jgi:hypothetical protein
MKDTLFVYSSHGDVEIDREGNVVKCFFDKSCCPEEGGCWISKVKSFDLEEHKTYHKINGVWEDGYDCLDLGGTNYNGTTFKALDEYRKNVYIHGTTNHKRAA